MTYSPRNVNGQAVAASSSPMVVASEQSIDQLVTGQASQSASGNNILLAVAGTGPTDTLGSVASYRSAVVQIVGSSGIASGQVTFEGSNDGTNWMALPYCDDVVANGTGTWAYGAFAIAASTSRLFILKITTRYIRCRISTVFSGGTVQAFTRLCLVDVASRVHTVTQGSGAQLSAVAAVSQLPAGTNSTVTSTASTNATSVRNAAANLHSVSISNPTGTAAYVKFYNKASAPTVGSDSPVLIVPAAANSFANYEFGPVGSRFSLGVALAVTGAIAAADTSNAVAGVLVTSTYI